MSDELEALHLALTLGVSADGFLGFITHDGASSWQRLLFSPRTCLRPASI